MNDLSDFPNRLIHKCSYDIAMIIYCKVKRFVIINAVSLLRPPNTVTHLVLNDEVATHTSTIVNLGELNKRLLYHDQFNLLY